MDKPVAEAPLFFLPILTFWEFWGAPKGTGFFRAVEKKADRKLQVSDKTLRKILEVDGEYSKRSGESFLRWVEAITEQTITQKNMVRMLKSYSGRRLVEFGWRMMLGQLSESKLGDFYPETLKYVDKLLDEETEYFQFMRINRKDLKIIFSARYTDSFYTKFALKVPEQNFQNYLTLTPEKAFEKMWPDPVFFRSSMHGCVSLNMDILAYAELEWLTKNSSNLSEIKSRLAELLPKIRDEKIVRSIPAYLDMLKDHFDISWHQMSEAMLDSNTKDPESMRRSLMRWVKGEKIPDFETSSNFFKNLLKGDSYENHMYFGQLFLAVSFIDRFLKEVLKTGHPAPPSEADIVGAFATYQEHFERHKGVFLAESKAA